MKTDIRFFFSRLKRVFLKSLAINDSLELDVRQSLAQLDAILILERTVEERSRMLESLVHTIEERLRILESLVHTTEERSRTLEYLARQSICTAQHQIDQMQKLYVESVPVVLSLNQLTAFNASSILELKTDYPIAVDSHDHISPESTTEGVSRPTFFVRNCINVLGQDITCLDIGSGAAGLVFEFAMNQVLAVGVDGSDFCRVNRIGYWPLLPNNLFTCDITKPFSFLLRDTQTLVDFDVITMWEVLEHIAESDLPILFSNISHHLGKHGYFIGSISLVEYVDSVGNPYHVTLKPRDWWMAKFIESGLVMLDTHPFNEKSFCRGNGPRFQDFHNYALNPSDGFWFVAQRIANSEPVLA